MPSFLVKAALSVILVVHTVTAADEVRLAPVTVEIATAMMRSVTAYSWIPGSIVSRSDARIASVIAGRVEWVADVGQRVKAGEPIARLDDTLPRLRAEELRAQVARAQTQRTVASLQLERFNQLAAGKVLSTSQLDDARSQRDMSNEDVTRTEAQLHQAQYVIEQSLIRAPFSGVVTERFVQRGEYVQVGGGTARLVNTGDIEARATAALSLAGNVHLGQVLTIRDHSTERLGKVRAVVPVGDDHSRQFEVRVAFDQLDWLVGTSVEVSIPSTPERIAVTVPRDALVIRQNRSYVLRVTSANRVEELDVATGTAVADAIEVRGRLTPGDRVVVRGAERLSAGQTVRLIGSQARPRP